jgi:hypothetical protein
MTDMEQDLYIANARIAVLEAELDRLKQVDRWIPVMGQNPGENSLGYVLAYSAELDQITMCRWWHILGDGVTTHWMPLPEPPKENTNG